MRKFFQCIKQAASDFSDDECMTGGAAIAYYSIFSLPPLLVMVFYIAVSVGVSREKVDQIVQNQLGIEFEAAEGAAEGGGTGQGDANQDAGDSGAPSASGRKSIWSRLAGIGLLIFSATGLFAQLQFALNRAWEVEPDPHQGGVVPFVLKRVFSLGMIVVIGFLLLIALVLTTLIDEIAAHLQGGTPTLVAQAIGLVLNNLGTLALATLLFAAMFKILPDAKMAWRDVWLGAGTTAVLFVLGKTAIAWYLQRSDMGENWGEAAASMIGVLVWVYYSSLIVLFGAELTQVWASEFGQGIEPARGAVRKVEEKRYVRGEDGQAAAPQPASKPS